MTNYTRDQIISTTKIIVLGLLLGLSIQLALAWNAPTGSAPGGNVSGPLTTGATQTKIGALRVNGGLVTPMTVDLDDSNYLLDPSGSSKLSSLTVTDLLLSNCDVKADASGKLYCGIDQTGGSLINFSCPNGQVISGFDAAGNPVCVVAITNPFRRWAGTTQSCSVSGNTFSISFDASGNPSRLCDTTGCDSPVNESLSRSSNYVVVRGLQLNLSVSVKLNKDGKPYLLGERRENYENLRVCRKDLF